MLKVLKSNRDMSVNEVKLTLAIEDPRARERRESMGIEVRQSEALPPCFAHSATSHSGAADVAAATVARYGEWDAHEPNTDTMALPSEQSHLCERVRGLSRQHNPV